MTLCNTSIDDCLIRKGKIAHWLGEADVFARVVSQQKKVITTFSSIVILQKFSRGPVFLATLYIAHCIIRK